MIDKKVLILTAAMVPMLGLSDVGATNHGRAQHNGVANHQAQQQNHIVVEIYGENYQYDAIKHALVANSGIYRLIDHVPASIDRHRQGITLKDYLCLYKAEAAMEMNLYDSIDNALPQECLQQLEMDDIRLGIVIVDDLSKHISWTDAAQITWREYLCNDLHSVAINLRLYDKLFYKLVPKKFVADYNEMSADRFSPDKENLTWAEWLCGNPRTAMYVKKLNVPNELIMRYTSPHALQHLIK